MSSRNLRVASAAFSVAAVLHMQLAAQKKLAPQQADAPVLRFEVEPTLAAMLQAARDTPDAERSVGTSAWIVFALIANGSTMRSGSHSDEVRWHIEWLANRQTESGAFAPRRVPCSRSEQQLAALATIEAMAASGHYFAIERNATTGIAAAHALMLAPKAPPATAEEFVVAILLARTASLSSTPAAIAHSKAVVAHAKSGMTVGKVRRIDAALHLDELLRGTKHPPDLTVARTWPASLTTDPLHTLVAALAVSVSPMHEKARAAQFEAVAALVAARETDGEHAGSWAPAGGFDRATTTAMHAITLALANGKTPLFCTR